MGPFPVNPAAVGARGEIFMGLIDVIGDTVFHLLFADRDEKAITTQASTLETSSIQGEVEFFY